MAVVQSYLRPRQLGHIVDASIGCHWIPFRGQVVHNPIHAELVLRKSSVVVTKEYVLIAQPFVNLFIALTLSEVVGLVVAFLECDYNVCCLRRRIVAPNIQFFIRIV